MLQQRPSQSSGRLICFGCCVDPLPKKQNNPPHKTKQNTRLKANKQKKLQKKQKQTNPKTKPKNKPANTEVSPC